MLDRAASRLALARLRRILTRWGDDVVMAGVVSDTAPRMFDRLRPPPAWEEEHARLAEVRARLDLLRAGGGDERPSEAAREAMAVRAEAERTVEALVARASTDAERDYAGGLVRAMATGDALAEEERRAHARAGEAAIRRLEALRVPEHARAELALVVDAVRERVGAEQAVFEAYERREGIEAAAGRWEAAAAGADAAIAALSARLGKP